MTLAEQQSWIKLNRNITRWRWYKNGNTVRVFLHLLLKANVKPNEFMSIKVDRGEAATSQGNIAKELGMSQSQVRTALNHLVETGELRITGYKSCSVYRIVKYNQYQALYEPKERPQKQQKKQTSKHTRDKDKSQEATKESTYTPKYWELDIPQHYHGQFKSSDEYYAYAEAHAEEVAQWVTN